MSYYSFCKVQLILKILLPEDSTGNV